MNSSDTRVPAGVAASAIAPCIAGAWAGFSSSSVGKEFACNSGDLDSTPGSGRIPEGGNGNSLQYSCLGHPMDRGAGQAIDQGIAKSRTRLSD